MEIYHFRESAQTLGEGGAVVADENFHIFRGKIGRPLTALSWMGLIGGVSTTVLQWILSLSQFHGLQMYDGRGKLGGTCFIDLGGGGAGRGHKSSQ
jgi:hypothetical protein